MVIIYIPDMNKKKKTAVTWASFYSSNSKQSKLMNKEAVWACLQLLLIFYYDVCVCVRLCAHTGLREADHDVEKRDEWKRLHYKKKVDCTQIC